MKKILVLLTFILAGSAVMGQKAIPRAETIAKQDLQIMEIKITKKYPNLRFNDSQKIKLNSVLLKRAEEIYEIRTDEGLSKLEFSLAYDVIAEKYDSRIEAIMSPEQKVVYYRKAKAQTRPR